jgi:hypothetical protein
VLLLSFCRALMCVYFLSFLFFFFLLFTFESDRCALVLLRVLCFFIKAWVRVFFCRERERERTRTRTRTRERTRERVNENENEREVKKM